MLALGRTVELLDRAMAYTRGALVRVGPDDLTRSTPCTRWDLGALLTHMDDSLDALTEGALGRVELAPTAATAPVSTRVESLQLKACGLLAAWSGMVCADARIGDRQLSAGVLAGAAALEIATHGWDVSTAIGGPELPDELAADLLPVARVLVTPGDRGVRFGPVLELSDHPAPTTELLGFLGRRPAGVLR